MQEIQQLLCMMIIFLIASQVVFSRSFWIHNLLGFGTFWLSMQCLVDTEQYAFCLISACFGLLVAIRSTLTNRKKRS